MCDSCDDFPPHCPGVQSLIPSPLCLPTCSTVPQTMAHVLIIRSSICRMPSWSWSHLDFAWLQEVESQGFIIPLPTEVMPVASGSQRLAGYPLQVPAVAQVVPEMWTHDLGCPVVHRHQASHHRCGVDGLSRAAPAGSCCAGLPLRGTSAIFSPVNLSPCLGRKD